MRVVVDTSIFIDYTRAREGSFTDVVKTRGELYVPTIVIAELWAGKPTSRKKERTLAGRLILPFAPVELAGEIAQKAGELVRDGKTSGYDSIIAATALYLDAHLATGDKKHFDKVKGLRFLT